MSPRLQRVSIISQEQQHTNGPAKNGQPALKLLWPIYFLLSLTFMTKTVTSLLASFPFLPSAFFSRLAEPRPADTP